MWNDLQRFFNRLDELRKFLDVASGIALSGVPHWNGAEREARGSAIVGCMAELESLIASSLRFVNSEINAQGPPVGRLVPTLRPLASHTTFISLSSLQDPKKVWPQRAAVTGLEMSLEPAALPIAIPGGREPQAPLDGRTLVPIHFERIAALYGIGLSRFLGTPGKLSLAKLSRARNDVAHGNVPFSQVFSQPNFTLKDIRGDVDNIEEIGWNFVVAFDAYLTHAMFLI